MKVQSWYGRVSCRKNCSLLSGRRIGADYLKTDNRGLAAQEEKVKADDVMPRRILLRVRVEADIKRVMGII